MKRTCEHCAFFEDNGVAKSGWCNHPDRRSAGSVQIMVRRGELACRNGWGSDLWVHRAGEVADGPIAAENATGMPLAPLLTSSDVADIVLSMQATVSGSPGHAGTAGTEDILVGQIPSSSNRSDIHKQKSASELVQTPRAAIIRAQQQYKERQLLNNRAQRAAEIAPRLDPGLIGITPPYSSGNNGELPAPVISHAIPLGEMKPSSPSATDTRRLDVVGPVTRQELTRPDPSITWYPEDAERFETVPVIASDFVLPLATQRGARRDMEPVVDSREFDAYDPFVNESTGDLPAPGLKPSRFAFLKRRHRPDLNGVPLPMMQEAWFEPTPLEARRAVPSYEPPLRKSMSRTPLTGSAAAAFAAQPEMHEDETRTDPGFNNKVGIATQSSIQAYLPAVNSQAAWGVTRNCRTCRDFKSAEADSRGWCVNTWAYPHRRMVSGTELSCESSAGDWWIAYDDVWLAAADVSHHGLPTPSYKKLLERMRKEVETEELDIARTRRGA